MTCLITLVVSGCDAQRQVAVHEEYLVGLSVGGVEVHALLLELFGELVKLLDDDVLLCAKLAVVSELLVHVIAGGEHLGAGIAVVGNLLVPPLSEDALELGNGRSGNSVDEPVGELHLVGVDCCPRGGGGSPGEDILGTMQLSPIWYSNASPTSAPDSCHLTLIPIIQ